MIRRSRLPWTLVLLGLSAMAGSAGAASAIPPAVYTDPPHDPQHPPRMEVLHIPSAGLRVNGIAYLAAGAGPHPTALFFIGLPGNEKNLDLVQAVRRGGWNAITFFFRGSWGSPGAFRFAHCVQDAEAALTYLRTKPVTESLGIDTTRMVIVGHSMADGSPSRPRHGTINWPGWR